MELSLGAHQAGKSAPSPYPGPQCGKLSRRFDHERSREDRISGKVLSIDPMVCTKIYLSKNRRAVDLCYTGNLSHLVCGEERRIDIDAAHNKGGIMHGVIP